MVNAFRKKKLFENYVHRIKSLVDCESVRIQGSRCHEYEQINLIVNSHIIHIDYYFLFRMCEVKSNKSKTPTPNRRSIRLVNVSFRSIWSHSIDHSRMAIKIRETKRKRREKKNERNEKLTKNNTNDNEIEWMR